MWDFLKPGIKLVSPAFFITEPPGKPQQSVLVSSLGGYNVIVWEILAKRTHHACSPHWVLKKVFLLTKGKWKSLSHVWLFATPWTTQSMEFSRPEYFPFSRGSSQPRDQTQASRITGGFFTSSATREAREYWKPIPSPGDLPDPGIKSRSPALQVNSLPTELSGKPFLLTKLIPYPTSNRVVLTHGLTFNSTITSWRR